jgi:hypothetical protein
VTLELTAADRGEATGVRVDYATDSTRYRCDTGARVTLTHPPLFISPVALELTAGGPPVTLALTVGDPPRLPPVTLALTAGGP